MSDTKTREALLEVCRLAAMVARSQAEWKAIEHVREVAEEEFDDEEED